MRRARLAALAHLVLVALVVAGVPACTRHAAPERPGELRDASSVGVGSSAQADAAPMDATVADAAQDAGDGRDAGDLHVLAGYPALFELRDGNDKLGFVAVPLGAHEPRPIMVALHGGSETPNTSTVCPAWQAIAEGYPFVVCPRGFGGNERALGWRTPADTHERIERAIAATKKAFPEWVHDTPTIVLVGFSMGATQVAMQAGEHPALYRRIVVGDSAHDPAPVLRFAPAWVKGGGERAVFLCTTSGCEPSHRAASKNVAAQKGRARLDVAPTQVHGLSSAVVQSMRRDWGWLVEGADGWQGYVAPPDPASLPGRTENFDP